MEHIEVAVYGAGVTGWRPRAPSLSGPVGLRARAALAARQDTSTHNSGVIHAGLYYPPAR